MSEAQIEIRRLGPDDASLLVGPEVRIEADVFDGPIRPDRLTTLLAAPGHLLAIVRIEDLVIGQVLAMVHHGPDRDDELYIDNFAIAPAYHRRGIGRRLLETALDWGRERGCAVAWVPTDPDNARAHSFYGDSGLVGEPAVLFVRAI